MEIIIAVVCGLIIGSSGTFTLGVIIFVVVKLSAEKRKFSLFSELAEQLESIPAAERKPKTKPTKTKHGRPKK